MITLVCQRWRQRRDAYRPAGEVIDPQRYDVVTLQRADAKAFVLAHHYAASFPAARFCVGLFRSGELVGVFALSHPASEAALDVLLPEGGDGRAELGRLVLRDDVPANGESYFVARAFELARREGFTAICSRADPAFGHVGTVYQATNGVYLGQARRRTRRVFADGSVLSDRVLSKLRAKEDGWERERDKLVARGAPPPRRGQLWARWVKVARDALTTPVRHPGTHCYAWALDRALRRHLPPSQAYPKLGR